MNKYETKDEALQFAGFNSQGFTFCVYGANTYSIKDNLKQMGCKFNPILKWHSPCDLSLPAGYKTFKIHFEELYIWNEEEKTLSYKENAKEIAEGRFKMLETPSQSEYLDLAIGERFYAKTAIYKSQRGFNSMYGWINVYTFEINYNILVWFTKKELKLAKETPVLLSGTVSKFEKFKGIKTTRINRCIVLPIETKLK